MSEKRYEAKICLEKELEGKSFPATYTHGIFVDDAIKAIISLLEMLDAKEATLSIDGKTYFIEIAKKK